MDKPIARLCQYDIYSTLKLKEAYDDMLVLEGGVVVRPLEVDWQDMRHGETVEFWVGAEHKARFDSNGNSTIAGGQISGGSIRATRDLIVTDGSVVDSTPTSRRRSPQNNRPNSAAPGWVDLIRDLLS